MNRPLISKQNTFTCAYCGRTNEQTVKFKAWWFVLSEYYGVLYFCCLICFWKWAERELFNKDQDDIVGNEIKERLAGKEEPQKNLLSEIRKY